MKLDNRKVIFTLLLLFFPALLFAQGEGYHYRILHQVADSLVLEVGVDNFSRQVVRQPSGEEWIEFSVPGAARTYERSAPSLPFITVSLAMDDANPRLYLLEQEGEEIEEAVPLPSRGMFVPGSREATAPLREGAVYQSSTKYPATFAAFGEAFRFEGYRGAPLHLYPFRYNAGKRAVEIARRMVIAVAADGIRAPRARGQVATRASRDRFINVPRVRGGESKRGKLLIVYPKEFEGKFDEYVRWKRMSGFEVEAKLFDKTGANALKSVEDISQFVKDQYAANSDVRYLLLLGDYVLVPSHLRRCIYRDAESDVVYGVVQGDEPYASIRVGRLPAHNADELSLMLQKSIAYERDVKSSERWPSCAIGIATGDQEVTLDDRTDQEQIKFLGNILTKNNYSSVVNFFDNQTETKLKASDVVTAVNRGVGLINYLGHGTATSWSSSKVSVSDALHLQNSGMWPFVISSACDNARTDTRENFAWSWLCASDNSKPTGAIAFTGATDLLYWVPPAFGQQIMVYRLNCDGYPCESDLSVGDIFALGLQKILENFSGDFGKTTVYAWNLFGDPSVIMRTQKPEQIKLESVSMVTAGMSELEVTCSVSGAFLTLTRMRNGEPVGYYHAVSQFGYATFKNLELSAGETLMITAVKRNCQVEILSDIPVVSNQEYNLFIYPPEQTITNSIFSESLSTGANFEVAWDYKNYGTKALTQDMKVEVIVDPAGILELQSSELTLEPLLNGAKSSSPLRAHFKVDESLLNDAQVSVTLRISDQKGMLVEHQFSRDVYCSSMQILGAAIVSDENNDKMVAPGEQIKVRFSVRNESTLSTEILGVEVVDAADPSQTPLVSLSGETIDPLVTRNFFPEFTLPQTTPAEGFWKVKLRLLIPGGKEISTSLLIIPGLNYEEVSSIAQSPQFVKYEEDCALISLFHTEEIPEENGFLTALEFTVYNPTNEAIETPSFGLFLAEASEQKLEDIELPVEGDFKNWERKSCPPGFSKIRVEIPPIYRYRNEDLQLKLMFKSSNSSDKLLYKTIAVAGKSMKLGWSEQGSVKKLILLREKPAVEFCFAKEQEVQLVPTPLPADETFKLSIMIGSTSYDFSVDRPRSVKIKPGIYPVTIVSDYFVEETFEITINPGVDRVEIPLRLPQLLAASVKVLNFRSDPIAGALVSIGNRTSRTDEHGIASFKLLPGSHVVHVSLEGFRDYETSFKFASDSPQCPIVLHGTQTGVDAASRSIRCFPNPASSLLTIEAEGAIERIELFSLAGQLFRRCFASGESRMQLSLRDVPAGMYILVVQHSGGEISRSSIVIE